MKITTLFIFIITILSCSQKQEVINEVDYTIKHHYYKDSVTVSCTMTIEEGASYFSNKVHKRNEWDQVRRYRHFCTNFNK